MLLNILITLAIIWLTFSIAVASISLWYTYTSVLPFLIDWDSSEETPQSQLTNDDIPEWDIGTDDEYRQIHDDDLPF